MKADDIILIGVKRAVLASRKENGEHLWATELKSGLGDDFVSLIADEKKVFAHTAGELHCLDLITGEILWRDKLAGFGYGLASLVIPGRSVSAPIDSAILRQVKRSSEEVTTNSHAT